MTTERSPATVVRDNQQMQAEQGTLGQDLLAIYAPNAEITCTESDETKPVTLDFLIGVFGRRYAALD